MAQFEEDVDGEFHVLSYAYPDAVVSVAGLPAGFTFVDGGGLGGIISGKPAIGSSR